MRILGIDPGPTECGVCKLVDGVPVEPRVMDTADCLCWLREPKRVADVIVIEKLECFGMAVGATVFETAYVIGRMLEIIGAKDSEAILMPRRAAKLHLCGSSRAKDPNIRQALIDRFGGDKMTAIGTRKRPGPLHGVKSHAWSALALAVTHAETHQTPFLKEWDAARLTT